jgi:small subunit ribosomal protein S1
VRSFGVFIDLGGADGLAHLSEVSWDRNRTPEDMYRIGDEVDVFVMKVDPETKKIALSLRRAQPEAWDEIVDKYQVGRVVPGMVTKLVTFGAFARIEGPVEGLIHVSELVDRRIAHPKEVVREGDLLPLKIVRIERDRHRLGLSLRDARDEGVRMGFNFSDAGEVIEVPEELRREFEEREGTIVRGARPLDDPGSVNGDAAAKTAQAGDDTPSETPEASIEAPAEEAPAEAAIDAPLEDAQTMPDTEASIEEPAEDVPSTAEPDTGQEEEAAT